MLFISLKSKEKNTNNNTLISIAKEYLRPKHSQASFQKNPEPLHGVFQDLIYTR